MIALKGMLFPSVYCATGARGFYGEGYPFHKWWRYLGMDWTGTGFSGKTVTLLPRRGGKFLDAQGNPEKGNMELCGDGVTPVEFLPQSIAVDFFAQGGEVINAVGLSNFGLSFYLRKGAYYRIREPFFISVSLDAEDMVGREDEAKNVCKILRKYLPFSAPVAIQINYGCPNSGHDLCQFSNTMCAEVEIFKQLGVPVFVNVTALMPTTILKEVSKVADGLWIGNTIPWRAQETLGVIDWEAYGKISPLRHRGINADGGLSSHVCLPFTIDKVSELRDSGVSLPIVAGNGIRSNEDILALERVGANGVFIGSLALVRPYRMRKIVTFANHLFSTNVL